MKTSPKHPETEADRRADRRTWIFFTGFMLASYLVEAMSHHDEVIRSGTANPNLPWLSEATSHGVILALVPFITFMLSRFPLSSGQWRVNLVVHAVGTIVFSLLHILFMVGLRKLLTPILFGFPYDFGFYDASVWLYEFRKDILSYALIAAIFALNRMVQQRELEAGAARREARDRHRLTLKSGGRTFLVEAPDVIWAKAASNYVEVVTPAKTYLARMTLTELEKLLESAGGEHVRTHRSHIVNMSRVQQVTPTGDGDLILELDTGDTVPGSRRFRDRINAHIA